MYCVLVRLTRRTNIPNSYWRSSSTAATVTTATAATASWTKTAAVHPRDHGAAVSRLLQQVSVTCLPGLESVLSQELTMLGIPPHPSPASSSSSKRTTKKNRKNQHEQHAKKNGIIHLPSTTTIEEVFRCCLYLGSASQLRVRVSSFTARGLSELQRKTGQSFAWEELFVRGNTTTVDDKDDDATRTRTRTSEQGADESLSSRLEVRVKASKSKLYHSGAIRERIVQGIQEQLERHGPNHHNNNNNTHTGTRGRGTGAEEKGADRIVLDVDVYRDQVQIFLTAFPTPLHRRGYRLAQGKAPLREDVAFAMLFMAGWYPAWMPHTGPSSSPVWDGLIDPFCGSGTIGIEGAAMKLGLPPGRLKHQTSPFTGTVLADFHQWSHAVSLAAAAAATATNKARGPRQFVSVSDRNAGAINATLANARSAGVLEALIIETAALSNQRWFDPHPSDAPSSLLVVTNPPFGKRIKTSSASLSSDRGLLTLYQSLGHCMQRLVTHQKDNNIDTRRELGGIVLTNNAQILSRTGASFIRYKTQFKTFHGGIKVWAMKFNLRNC